MNGGEGALKRIMNNFRLNSRLSSQINHNFKVDALSASFFALAGGALYPFVAAIAINMGAGALGVGLLVAAPFAAQLFTIYWGHLCQGRQKLAFIIYPGIAARLLLLPLVLVNSPAVFINLIKIHHRRLAITWPAFTSLVQKMYPMARRGRLMGLVKFVFGIFNILAIAVAGRSLDLLGHPPVILVGVAAGITATLIFRKIQEPEEEKETAICRRFSPGESLRQLRQFPALTWFIVGMSFLEIGKFMLQPFLPLYWLNELGLSQSNIGSIAVVVTLFWFLSSPLWGVLVDRFHPVGVVMAAGGLYCLLPLLYLGNPGLAGVLVGAALTGLGLAAYEVGWSNNLLGMAGRQSGKFIGLYLSLVGLRGLLSPLLASVILGGGQAVLLLILAALFILASFPALIHSYRLGVRGRKKETPEVVAVKIAQ